MTEQSDEQSDDRIEGIPLVPGPSAVRLNERQFVDYRAERRTCIEWLLAVGESSARRVSPL
jgi:hypothetical protein